ncbi:MAG: PmoA family protein [Fuerstiella sp.]
MKPAVLLASALFLCLTAASTSAVDKSSRGVSFQSTKDGQLGIQIDGKKFAVLNHGKEWNKPFLFPVHAPNGTNVLRDIVPTKADAGSSKEGKDHFHHKGVWVSVDSVNDDRLNFWSEAARIECEGVEHSAGKNGSGQLTITNNWMEGDKPLLQETTTVTIYPSRLLTYHIELSAIDTDVTIYDTKEGFFAVRLAHTMREMEGGHITNADGLKGEKDCWGKPSPWIDYYGAVNGSIAGVTLMDHPGNFRQSRYHVRSYGLFSISPFGPKKYSNGKEAESPVTIRPGKPSFKLDYGLYIHDGDTETANVAGAYQQFLKVTGS